ncbi:MAG: hypothetical protein J6W28_05475, partial [Clostridia bacterium]|nr:hypothetical protein [Clostridia bacterium]
PPILVFHVKQPPKKQKFRVSRETIVYLSFDPYVSRETTTKKAKIRVSRETFQKIQGVFSLNGLTPFAFHVKIEVVPLYL